MATSLLVADVPLIRIVCKDPTGGECINVLHYLVTAIGGAPATDADLASAFDTACEASIKAALNSGWTYDGVECSIQNRVPLPLTQKNNVSAGAGAGIGTPAPSQVCGILSWGSLLSGRKFRGRTYVGGVSAGNTTSTGLPTNAYQALLTTLGNAIIGFTNVAIGGRTATIALALWHKATRTTTLITTGSIPVKFATQRRRGLYGKNRTPPI